MIYPCKTLFVITCLFFSSSALALKDNGPLLSGAFDDFLIISGSNGGSRLTGYYNDGKCRFYFTGPLEPVELFQRRDDPRGYIVDAWDPRRPDRAFSLSIASIAKKGFHDQLTLLLPQRDQTPLHCRSRISLDRSNHVSKSFTGVRVVRTKKISIYQIVLRGSKIKLVIDKDHPKPRKDSGVWIAKTYRPGYPPAGYVFIAWYDFKGRPYGGYVRERHLYPDSIDTHDPEAAIPPGYSGRPS